MADKQTCYVYIQLPGTHTWVTCASLSIEEVGAQAYLGEFLYGQRYLERSNVIPLDSYLLPLRRAVIQFTKLKGVPGPVRDASPDYWGRRVIQAKLDRKDEDLTEIDYLLNGPDDGAGNLRFGLDREPPGPPRRFNRTHQLSELVHAAQILQEDGRLPYEVLENLEPGTSMGGARPKATIEDQHKIWLAKLPEKDDRHNMQRIEYATLELARQANLNVCGTRLESLGATDVLMLERFDRKWNPTAQAYDRYGLVSGLTILDAEDGYQGRERWSYPLLAQELRRRSVVPNADCLELFRRMVFNAMVTNNDDHPRNHAMLHTPGGWRLSPAYDIVPMSLVSQERRDLALTVGEYGRVASVYNILSSCEEFGITDAQARQEIEAMRAVVNGWRQIYAAHGVSDDALDMLEGAILPACFDLTEPVSSI